MLDLIKLTYILSAIQYIVYDTLYYKTCPLLYLSELSFWITIIWIYYFFINEHNSILYLAITIQIIVTLGRLYELYELHKTKQKITIHFYEVVAHYLGFIIAIYMIFMKLHKVHIDAAKYLFFIILSYLAVFMSYQKIYKKCDSEPGFSKSAKMGVSNNNHTIVFTLISVVISIVIYNIH